MSENSGIYNVTQLISVAGGMSVLHLFPFWSELESITWVDVNCHALDNAQLILTLISISNDRSDYVKKVFCRDPAKVSTLTVNTVQPFMDIEPDEEIRNQTLSKLSPKLQRLYQENIVPRAQTGPISNNTRVNQHIILPLLQNNSGPLTQVGKIGVVNRGSLDYGFGAMASDAQFQKLKSAVQRANHKFYLGSLWDAPISSDSDLAIYASNILSFSGFEQRIPIQHAILDMKKELLDSKKVLHIISVPPIPKFDGMPQNDNYLQLHARSTGNTHFNAFYWLTTMVDFKENIVEVLKHELLPGGMSEFPRTVLSVEKFMSLGHCRAHTIILHILVGEGAVEKTDFFSIYQKAASNSQKVIVMDWEAESTDHVKIKDSLFRKEDVIQNIGKPSKELCVPGLRDHCRIFLLQYRGTLIDTLFSQPTCSIST
ncbi:hypothetical protein PSENEW3n2_00000934 [Picochlorum sp. SENEW3]|nr:hypothetical protein PSENEW3n2_00000934 [Picochlorum sp. SENEW3]WPT14990.1 hypothetical protein PSENEW3_00000934 [Picochlorum sp. SENEW3]